MIRLYLTKFPLLFAQKLFIALSVLFALAIFIMHQYINGITEANLYTNLGERAQIQAKEIAAIPELALAVKKHDLNAIKDLITLISEQSDASYIVIGDKNATRLFHTENVAINVPMVGDDNQDVLKGKSIIIISQGSLGQSLRGKSPIIDNDDVIGIVSVGYMLDRLNELHKIQSYPFIIFCLILFFFLFVFSYIFSYLIKKQMFNLEPKEISLLVKMQSAIMESINEGLISVDLNYNIIHINQFARQFLNIPQHTDNLQGTNLFLYILSPNDLLRNDDCLLEDVYDRISHFNHEAVIASRIRLIFNDKIQGWVVTFRNMNEINLLSKRLSQVQQYADNLRALRHEHQNWLATLLGLIYMQRYEDAKEFITRQSSHNQQQLDFITERFQVPTIAGLLIGKFTKANEMGLELEFDPMCQLKNIPNKLIETEFMSIIANLLDNAFTASLIQSHESTIKEKKIIHLYLSDATDEHVIEVSDEGHQIDEAIKSSIFKLGVTTKSKGHGIGLYLVKTYTEKANGYIEINNNLPQGTIFSIFIPK
ncbi:sensor histidine kinase [Orbus sturtevantii]|uniref:ATP-binding protein n=1 Tax=Orbus sturtevantii TaxID=3074109 RepID=UPI00370DAFB5